MEERESYDESVSPFPVRGVIRSSHQATISAPLTARIVHIGFFEGETFNQGDLLVALDCSRQSAELDAARALQREMELQLESVIYLHKRGASSKQELQIAGARMERTKAEAQALKKQVSQCRILAPYDGDVSEQLSYEHEMASAGKPILSIVAKNEPKIELIVPSSWLAWLEEGTQFRFSIDETQQTTKAEVVRLGAQVDSISQSIKVFAKFKDPKLHILPGMTGTAEFSTRHEG